MKSSGWASALQPLTAVQTRWDVEQKAALVTTNLRCNTLERPVPVEMADHLTIKQRHLKCVEIKKAPI